MAYTTLALVKSSLGIPDAVTSEDTAINAAIGAADALIDNYTGRTFEVSATSVETALITAKFVSVPPSSSPLKIS